MRWLWFLVLVSLGVALMAVSGWLFARAAHLAVAGIDVRGEVTGFECRRSEDSEGESCFPKYTYVVEGEAFTGVSSSGSSTGLGYEAGDNIWLAYLPGEPDQARPSSPIASVITLGVLGLFGGAMIGGGVAVKEMTA